MSVKTELEHPSVRLAGLRTRLVSRLTGLSESKLRYWHESDLHPAELRHGRRGIPRLYSWVDYMRLRVISVLVEQGVPTRRIRVALQWLDEAWPEWYMLPERTRVDRAHVLTMLPDTASPVRADEHGQMQFELTPDDEAAVNMAIESLTGRGADLGRLRAFSDAVEMRPAVNLAKPTLVGTSLETRFLRELADDLGGPEEVASIYRLDPVKVGRAIEFEEAVA